MTDIDRDRLAELRAAYDRLPDEKVRDWPDSGELEELKELAEQEAVTAEPAPLGWGHV